MTTPGEPPTPEAVGGVAAHTSASEEPATVEGLRAQLRRMEHLLGSGEHDLKGLEAHVLMPAWRRVTKGEPRWPVSLAVLVAIALQLSLPDHLAFHPRGLLPVVQALVLVALIVANPRRIERHSMPLRVGSAGLIALMSVANAWSAGRLIAGLVGGTEHQSPGHLLLSGGAIWVTNVIVFALWYWELDRGGPAARTLALRPYPDFLFAQMQSPDLAPPHWEPAFLDYLYLSFTNAAAFSPTDVLPLARWGKGTMMVQSAISLATVALVIARAVNILQ